MREESPFKNRRRRTSLWLAMFFASGLLSSIALAPQAALAQAGPCASTGPCPTIDPATIQTAVAAGAISGTSANTSAQESQHTVKEVKDTTWQALKISLTNTAILALLNGANYFAQKIAYDTANYIASGGKGQAPLFSIDGIEGELKSAGGNAVGEVLGTLTKDPNSFSKFGVNLCAPSDPTAALNFKLGFLSSVPGILGTAGPAAPQPSCSWDNISNNWSAFASSQTDYHVLLNNVGVMFSPGESSLSAAIQLNNVAITELNKNQQASIDKYLANSGFKDLTAKISGKVKTPADVIKTEQNLSLQEGWKQGDKTVALSASAVGNGAFAILPAMLQTFAGTLSQKLLSKVFEKGLITLNSLFKGESDVTQQFDGSPIGGGKQAAELANASLLTPKILSITNYNEVNDFAACPTPRGQNNCVIDGQFFAAVNRSSQGQPITVRQAADQGFLNRNWALLPLNHRKNIEATCFNEAYCYSNLVKLRKASVLPIGWELAANSPFNDVNRPVTLGEAMDHFEDCPRTADGALDTTKLPDSLHPWCHLVDPEWVLKYPQAICRQQAFGPTLVASTSSARAQVCVDSARCIAQDASGNCVGGYGYCVREKNVWNIDADSCPAQFASCTNFARTDGANFSFLANTLETGPCNAQNAGCKEYSRSRNAVPNPGFEDLLDGAARDWALAGAKLDRSGLAAESGTVAVGVTRTTSASAKVFSLQPAGQYVLSASVLQELAQAQGAPAVVGGVTLSFLTADGSAVSASDIATTCTLNANRISVSLGISASHLGYLTGSCTVTAPADATSGSVTLSSTSADANDHTFFDEIGLYGDSFSASPYDSLILNGKVEKCASDQAGCTDLVRLATGTLNLVRDPGFETPDASGAPAYWNVPTPAAYEKGSLKGFEGVSAVKLDPDGATQDVRGLVGSAGYSFSAYTKLDGGAAGRPRATIQIYDNSTPPKAVAPASVSGCTSDGTAMGLDLATGADYARTSCSFTTPADASYATVKLFANAGSTALVDAVQIELAVQPTDFHDAYASSAAHVYLKTAPPGLVCTGANRSPECDLYAPSCRRDEVGCSSYAPVGGGTSVPAVTTSADACPTQCVGYDTFKQEPSNFDDGRFPLFLIPTTATACTAEEAGCSEFTNVQKLAQGGEAREYYSYLRLCVKPGPEVGAYYTFEGTEATGIQLRNWSLLKSNIASSPVTPSDPTGGNAPCTALRYGNNGAAVCGDSAVSVAAASCEKVDLMTDPDCREFYDVAGNIHYRLYSKTIVSSDSCTEYRITKSTDAECVSHGGFLQNGECRYFALSGESTACRASASGCRAYGGNASRNIRVASSDDFETGTTGNWKATAGTAVNSNESVAAGGHSLKASGAGARVVQDVATTVHQGKSYVLSFWAKGNGDLAVGFSTAGDKPFTFNRISGLDAPITLSTEWRSYDIGPVQIVKPPAIDGNNPANDEMLAVSLSGSASPLFYLDNVVLREVTDNTYLIQDSWNTPVACDQTPSGSPSPQYMLGCRAYTDQKNANVSLKSFDRICRPEAVGCEALYDTHHTSSPFPQTFSAVCTLPSSCPVNGSGATCGCQIGAQTVCQVTAGQASCRYDADDAVPASRVSPSGDTVRVPADSLVYLVDDSRYACDQSNVGCTAMGDRTMNRENTAVDKWSTVYLKDDPANYSNILCRKAEVMCQAYTRTADGSSVYFRAPEARTCEYKQGVLGYSGWFKTGTSEPCYPDFLQSGTQYGIWKNSDPAYAGWAGSCEPQYDMCKEFIDPSDTSTLHPAGQPYYAIMNDRLDVSSCANRASLTQSPSGANVASACVLFWRSDDLVKTFDSKKTYAASDTAHGSLVPAVGGTNDANVVLRVNRDRQCGAWLDCRTSETVFNASSGQYQNVCTAFSLCAEFEHVGNTTRCVRYVNSDYAGTTLTPKVYEARDTGWKGTEFTGYAIPNQYPVDELVTVNIGSSVTEPILRLVRVGGACSGNYGSPCGPASDPGTCLGPAGQMKCTYPIDDGRKVSSSAQISQSQFDAGYPAAACRAYPDESAPFPSSVADPSGWNMDAAPLNNNNPTLRGLSPAFAGANVCQRRLDANGVEVSDCECNYVSARYGSDTRYFPASGLDIPSGYCDSGSFKDYECDPLASGPRSKTNLSCCSQSSNGANDPTSPSALTNGCSDSAQCIRLSKVDNVVGYQGQCLERDYTAPVNGRSDEFACQTWRPVGLIGGSRDIYNQNQTAGYFASADRRFYCVGNQPAWALHLDINAMSSDGKKVDTSGDKKNAFGQPLGPNDQFTTNYFGPGKVTNGNPKLTMEQNLKCQDLSSGQWCAYPTTATLSIIQQTDKNSNGDRVVKSCDLDKNTGGGPSVIPLRGRPGEVSNSDCAGGYICAKNASGAGECQKQEYFMNKDAIGILGCYSFADEGSADATYIDYPYIGKNPLYRQQLQSIYFQVVEDLYFNDANLANLPTNPQNNVLEDCDDDEDDSNAPNIDREHEHEPVTDADVTKTAIDGGTGQTIPKDNLDHSKQLYYLDDANGWKIDASGGGGVILLSAAFDDNGQLKSIRVAASDGNDSGTFGIQRMGFVFRPGCSEVAQVDRNGEFGATTAFTNAVNPARNFNRTVAQNGQHDAIILDAGDNTIVPARAQVGIDQSASFGDACHPWGAIGAVSQKPPTEPWTYIAARRSNDVDQCTVLDFTKANVYQVQSPEHLADFPPTTITAASWAASSIRNLFRAITDAWTFVKFDKFGQGGGYNLLPRAGGTNPALLQTYDETSLVDAATLATRAGNSGLPWHPPRIAAVDIGNCDATGRCKTGRLDSLTVNGRQEGTLNGADGSMSVTAKFYGWASHNAMPINSRTVIWGDLAPTEPPAVGFYKNQKPFCSPDISDPNAIGECSGVPGLTCDNAGDCPSGSACVKGQNAFGNTPGACSANTFQFDHTYTCSLSDLRALGACADGPGGLASNAPCLRSVGGAQLCVYRPKVQIVDNWGWCNCSGPACRVAGGAYKSDCNLAAPNPNALPWTEFAGEIRISPTADDAKAFTP